MLVIVGVLEWDEGGGGDTGGNRQGTRKGGGKKQKEKKERKKRGKREKGKDGRKRKEGERWTFFFSFGSSRLFLLSLRANERDEWQWVFGWGVTRVQKDKERQGVIEWR